MRRTFKQRQRPGVQCRLSKRRFRCPGFGTVEILVSLGLFGVLLSSVGPIVHSVSVASRAGGDRWTAHQELSSLMDRIAALPADQRDSKRVEALRNAAGMSSDLEAMKLMATVSDPMDGLVRVDVSATWQSDSKTATKPVSLTAWFRGPASHSEDAT